MRGKGEGAIYRVPADRAKPLQHWTATIELPPGPKGERRRKTVRRKNKAELLTELKKLRADFERTGNLPTSGETVEQWFRHWLESVAKRVRPNTYDQYRNTVEKHVIPAIGNVRLAQVGPTHIKRVHDAVLAKGLSSTTALLAHRTMSTSFKVALREGRMTRNPATLVDAPPKAAPKLEALELDEALQVLRHTQHDEALGALWWGYLLTGARRGEMLGLEVDRVGEFLDLSWQLLRLPLTEEEGVPQVPADYEYRHLVGGLYLTRPKSTGSHRIIPLVDPLRTILLRHIERMGPDPSGLLFTYNERPIGPDIATSWWRDMLRAAGIQKRVRLHDSRHTTADLLYEAEVPEDIIMEILGQTVRATTRGYKTKQNARRLIAAMERFSAPFMTLIDPLDRHGELSA